MPTKSTVKGSKGLKGSVRSNGHSSSGGHSMRQNSALSRINRIRWDCADGTTGADMSFQYQEYPKHVYNDPLFPKKYVVVNSASEEQQILGGEEVLDEAVERERLFAVAKVKKINVDKRWGPAKLAAAIEAAGGDPTLNPFE